MTLKRILLLSILLALVHVNAARKSDKKIELEDIEQDNLKSEREKEDEETKHEYLRTASAQNDQQQYIGGQQFTVEEDHSTNPYLVYSNNNQNYAHLQGNPSAGHPQQEKQVYYPPAEIPQQEKQVYYPSAENPQQEKQVYYQPDPTNSIEENPAHQQIPSGYVTVPMRVIYVPQYYTPENQNPNYYSYVPQQEGIKYVQEQQNQPEKDASTSIRYVPEPAPVYDNYAQYEDEKAKSNQNYAQGGQQYAYINMVPQNNPSDYKYVHPSTTQSIVPQYESVKQILHGSQNGEAGYIPRVVPQYQPQITSPVYSHISGNLPGTYDPAYKLSLNHLKPQTPPSHLEYNVYPVKNPKSLLDSYIPSSLQIEYLKRGYSNDLASTYDTILRKGVPKFLEGGFIPNQMFTDANGLVSYGRFKRSL